MMGAREESESGVRARCFRVLVSGTMGPVRSVSGRSCGVVCARAVLAFGKLRSRPQAMVFVLGLGSAAVLARLLTPDDYGLIGMAGAFIAIIMNFADLGLPLATVQQKRVTNAQVNSLFWITFGFGLLSCLLGCLLAWPVLPHTGPLAVRIFFVEIYFILA